MQAHSLAIESTPPARAGRCIKICASFGCEAGHRRGGVGLE